MTMHIPPIGAMACHTTEATARPWLWRDRYQPAHRPVKDEARECRAFSSKEQREAIQGDSCDGCARLPGDQR